jgi:hypothetical protein
MQENMTARRVELAKEEQRYTSAIATMRSSQRYDLALRSLPAKSDGGIWVFGRRYPTRCTRAPRRVPMACTTASGPCSDPPSLGTELY